MPRKCKKRNVTGGIRKKKAQNCKNAKKRPSRAQAMSNFREGLSTEEKVQRKSLELIRISTRRDADNRSQPNSNQFHLEICQFAEYSCPICFKLCYYKQTAILHLTPAIINILPEDFHQDIQIRTCNRCKANLLKSKVPPQAYWNAMDPGEIPLEISELTEMEIRLLSRAIPFIRMIKLGGRFGQYGFKGQAVLFGQQIEELAQQLPLRPENAGVIVVAESLEGLDKVKEFQVDLGRLQRALEWLIRNNPLYRGVQINMSDEPFNLEDICQISEPSESTTQEREDLIEITFGRGIIRGSFHQGHECFGLRSRGKQCTANAATAIALWTILPPVEWKKESVDSVLLSGNRFYLESTAHEENPGYLCPSMLNQHSSLLGREINFTFGDENQQIYGTLLPVQGVPELAQGIENLFEISPSGILISKDHSVALLSRDESFWMFDSHSRGAKGMVALNGTAFIMRFPTINAMSSHFKKLFPPENAQYTITPVSVEVEDLPDEVEMPIEEDQEMQVSDLMNMQFQGCQDEDTMECEDEFEEGSINSTEDSMDLDLSDIDSLIDPKKSLGNIPCSVLHPSDYVAPFIGSVLVDDAPSNPIWNLKRKTEEPINISRELKSEEIGWWQLFPNGKNGFNEDRPIKITPLDYFQSRIMGKDKRFKRMDYLFFALSVYEYYKAKSNASVCCQIRSGGALPNNIASNIHLNMKGIRGSNSYWQTVKSELMAMIRNLGPPHWFVTLSSNDLNWPDMLEALLIAEGRPKADLENLTFEDKRILVENNPVTLSRQFMSRFYAFMRALKRDASLFGKTVKDYWWRVEFQNRGSPHIHMLVWNEDMPSFETPEGLDLINQIVKCSIPPEEDELKGIVENLQIHKHTTTCYKNKEVRSCRFGFPRPQSDQTYVLRAEESLANQGRFVILERKSDELMVNNYNRKILELWGGNMDIQAIVGYSALAYYIAKYASKTEPWDVGEAVKEAISKVKGKGGSIQQQLFSVSMTLLNHRKLSACECAYRLCHLPFKESSRKAIFLNTIKPEERYRMVRFGEGDNDVYHNIFDRYEKRPDSLVDLSLAEFSVKYETLYNNSNFEEEDCDLDLREEDESNNGQREIIRLKDGLGRMKERTRPAVLRTKYFTQATDREGYFYSLLVCHVPFLEENLLLEGYESAEAAFYGQRHLLRPLIPGVNIENFLHAENELNSAIAQIEALEAYENEHPNHGEEEDVNNEFDRPFDPISFNDDGEGVDDEEEEGVQEGMTDEEFHHRKGSMNHEQRRLFNLITDAIRSEILGNVTEKMRMFITGGAGAGKSFVLKLLVEQIKRCYAPTEDPLISPIFVEVGAPTGAAARLINGRTLHSLFALPIEKGFSGVYRPMTGIRLDQERRKWRKIQWLIIEEVSMVSYETLRTINLRLQELKGNIELFGGVNVLYFGDIMQLPPVHGSWCFKQPQRFESEPHIWRIFKFFELKENMRQREDQEFIGILNSLRFGELSGDQLEVLMNRTREFVPEEGEFSDENAIRIMPTNQLVDNYNSRMIAKAKMVQRIYKFLAKDKSLENTTYGQIPRADSIPKDINNTGGIAGSLELGINSRVMLRRNISVSEGLVNGALGVVKGIQWPLLRNGQMFDGELPSAILVLFDDPLIGRNRKDSNGFVPISPVSTTFDGKGSQGKIERIMLPFILAWAVTVHKLQGTSLDKGVINLGSKTFAKGQSYVALSRVRSLNGICISDLEPRKLLTFGKVTPHDPKPLEEMQRLRTLDLNI